MLRSLAQRFRRFFELSFPWLERQAARKNCSLQFRMDIDEGNQWLPKEFRARFGGFHPPGEQRDFQRVYATDRVRSDMLALLLREIVVSKIPGSLAELGVHHVVHDYNAWPGARIAVDDFRRREKVIAVPMPDKSGSVVLAK